MNDQLRQQLEKEFTNTQELVRISALVGNGEGLAFAEEIRQYLNKRGFTIGDVRQFMQAPAIDGQVIARDPDGTRHIKVGIQV